MALERTAHESTSRTTISARAERLEAVEPLARVDVPAEGHERRDRGERERGEQCVRGRARRRRRARASTRERRRRAPEECDVPRAIASPFGRTILLYPGAVRNEKEWRGMATLTWLGHATFLLSSDEGKRIYVDPFLTGNPKTPGRGQEARARRHHRDHARARRPRRRRGRALEGVPRRADRRAGRAEGLARRAGRERRPDARDNKGGTTTIDGITFTLVNAFHSSSSDAGEYLGEAVRDRDQARGREDGLLRRRHLRVRRHGADPTASTSPTTRCSRSATTSRWARRKRRSRSSCSATRACIPCHWGTFPVLTGTPEQLRAEAPEADVIEIAPGETVEL